MRVARPPRADALGQGMRRGTHNLEGNPFLLPGIALKTAGNGDHFPIEQMVLQRYQKGAWKAFGGLWGYRES